MDKLTFETLKPRLLSLGFGFYGDASRDSADPEQTIIDVVQLFRDESKAFKMLLAWLERYGDLVHVERIRVLASDLSDYDRRILGALALKQVKNGDRRFSLLVDWAKKSKSSKSAKSSEKLDSDDPYLISKHGVDEELREFGIKSATVGPADVKKLLAIEEVLRRNAWLRFRALIGANFRADLAFVMAHKRASTAYQAAKLLGCSIETAYRLWKGLQLYPGIEKLAG
ncbi:MAG: hypothetical protein HY074_16805 [Deltaproteobacteria bacterium]|nr:hypothetical protein [Deltaproteobacteria bacterium]